MLPMMLAVFLLFCPLLVFGQPGWPGGKSGNSDCCTRADRPYWFNSLDAESLHSYDQVSLDLSVTIADWNTPLEACAILTVIAREDLSEIPLNAMDLTLDSVLIDRQIAQYSYANDTLRVFAPISRNDTVVVEVRYTALPATDPFATGYHNAWEHVYTFSEPYGARKWFPCWDQPYDKFSQVRIRADIPAHWSLASNGLMIEEGGTDPGRKFQTYYHNHPISPYLVNIAAGNFSRREFNLDGIQYRYFAWPRSDSAQAEYDWARTPEMVEYFSELFGDFPFDEYGMVMADLFGGWGAMEHQTFTTYGFHLVDSLRTFEGIVAHELAHQWFGDHLSPVDFRNMWLNEGFATYGNALWTKFAYGDDAFRSDMRNAASFCFQEEQSFPSYPVYDPPEDRLFGANVYFKGAWVLHMLKTQLLGDSVYFAALRDYVSRFAGGNVDTQDFIDVVNDHYGQEDLDWFFEQWVYGLRFPIIRTSFREEGGLVRLTVEQTTPYFRFPLVLEQGTEGFTETDTLWFDAQPSSTRDLTGTPSFYRLASEQISLFQDNTANSEDPPALPIQFEFSPPYPNPFNASVNFEFQFEYPAQFEIKLLDLHGRMAATVYSGRVEAGKRLISFKAPVGLASGVYFVNASTERSSKTHKLLLLK